MDLGDRLQRLVQRQQLSEVVTRRASQNAVIGVPLTNSITKYGRPAGVVPPSRTFAMFGWSISASACRSASNRASTARESIPALTSFSATRRLTGSDCSATHLAHAALADALEELVPPDDVPRLRDGAAVGDMRAGEFHARRGPVDRARLGVRRQQRLDLAAAGIVGTLASRNAAR